MVGGVQNMVMRELRGLTRGALPQGTQVAARVAGLGLDHLQLSSTSRRSLGDLERSAFETLKARKIAEAAATLTPARAATLAGLEPTALVEQLKYMAPARLRELSALQPGVVATYERQAAATQAEWLGIINPTLAPFGVQAEGRAKSWQSMLGRLDKNSEKFARKGWTLPDGRPMPSTLVDLHDPSRGRIDLPGLDPRELKRMARAVEDGLARVPGRQFSVKLWDRTTPELLADSRELYRGRLHLRIEDITGGVPRGAFELQLGPKSVSQFMDQRFSIPGLDGREFSIHDGIYKGVAMLRDERHLEAIGRDRLGTTRVSRSEAVREGQVGVNKALGAYREQLDAALDCARTGRPFDYDRTLNVRKRIARITKALDGHAEVPEGLLGRAR